MKKKYMMIYEDVKSGILDQTYPVGAQIPDEKTMCEKFSCSRMTNVIKLRRDKNRIPCS